MVHDREYTRLVINERIAAKRRAPHATAAKRALQKAQMSLRKQAGGQPVEITEFDDQGNILTGSALQILQRGGKVTLRAYKQISEGTHWLLDPQKMEVCGEITVQIPVAN